MKKIAVDILMGIIIILEFVSLPILLHEVLGIGLAFLIILHINYIKSDALAHETPASAIITNIKLKIILFIFIP